MALRIALVDSQVGSGHRLAYAQAIIEALRETGHVPVIVGSPQWCSAFERSGLECHPVPPVAHAVGYRARGQAFQRFLGEVFERCEDARCDVVHLLYLDGFLQALLAVGLPHRMTTWATLHWYPFLGMHWRQPRLGVKGWLTRWWMKRLVARGLRLAIHSRAAADAVPARFAGRTLVLDYPNFDTLPMLDASGRTRVRRRLGISDDVRLFLCFGGTRADKGADLAIRALAATPAHCHLLIAGAEQHFDEATLRALATDCGVADRVHLDLRFIPDTEVAAFFSAADAVLLPYRPEFGGQSGPLLIGASMGLPVICSDLPVLSETLQRFGFGRTVPPGVVPALGAAMAQPLPPGQGARQQALREATEPRGFGLRMANAYAAPAVEEPSDVVRV